jgi:hypothetical protein
VLAALKHERAYQDMKWNAGTTASGGQHTPTEWLVYIEDYIREATQFTSRHPEPEATHFVLHAMRKIGAMAVACQEQNGVRTREREGPRAEGFSAT